MKYKIWDKQQTLITPIGEVLTSAQVFERYPASAIEGIQYIICDSPISLGVFMEFSQTKENYKARGAIINDSQTTQEVLDAITYFEENPAAPLPSAEERMAAAMEFQNMMAL